MKANDRSNYSPPLGGAGGGLLRFLKNWTLPVAIAVGTVCYLLFALTPSLDAAGDALLPFFETLLPLTIFLTLFVTFSKVDFHLMRLHRWHFFILLAQLILVALITLLILHLSTSTLPGEAVHPAPTGEGPGEGLSGVKLLMEAVLVCMIAPCAAASPVVTAKLDGDLAQMTAFVLLSALVGSLLIPAVFPIVEPTHDLAFMTAFLTILKRIAPVLLLPLLLGAIVRHWVRPLYCYFMRTPDIGFYIWSVSLAITSGLTVRNIIHSHASAVLLTCIAVLTLLTALVQFRIGRFVGNIVGETVCTGQAMFQKNTGLAIWIAYVYLTPEASIGAGCYVLWQNIINSWELWQHRKRLTR